MTAEELTFEILDRRKIVTKEKDYWSCFEVNEREEAGQWPGWHRWGVIPTARSTKGWRAPETHTATDHPTGLLPIFPLLNTFAGSASGSLGIPRSRPLASAVVFDGLGRPLCPSPARLSDRLLGPAARPCYL